MFKVSRGSSHGKMEGGGRLQVLLRTRHSARFSCFFTVILRGGTPALFGFLCVFCTLQECTGTGASALILWKLGSFLCPFEVFVVDFLCFWAPTELCLDTFRTVWRLAWEREAR